MNTKNNTKHTLVFTPPTGSLVCVTFPDATQPIEGQPTYTNKATINGASLEATATVKAAGGTDGNGTVKPTPTPAPSTEPTPEPTPTTPSTPATPAPKPSDEPQSTPTPDPTPEPRVTTEPVPVPTHATPKPEPKADQPAPTPAAQLAKTGATLDGITVALGSFALGALLAAGGYAINRRFSK